MASHNPVNTLKNCTGCSRQWLSNARKVWPKIRISARACAGQNRFREALDNALEVVIRDRFFDEGAGRKAILALFEALSGEQYDDLVREFRRKLSAALN